VMARAGRFAAEWTRDAMPALRRRWLLAMPRWWRARAVLGLASRAIRDGYAPSKVLIRVKRGQARIEIRHSLFCRVRDTLTTPQCDYHAALIAGLLTAVNLPAAVTIECCSAKGDGYCVITAGLTGAAASVEEVS